MPIMAVMSGLCANAAQAVSRESSSAQRNGQVKIVSLGGALAGRLGLIDKAGDGVAVLSEGTSLSDLAEGRPITLTDRIALDEAVLDAPLIPGSRIICVGLNFFSHAKEVGQAAPQRPAMFSRYPSSFVGPGQDIILPSVSAEFDYEVELAAVIGRAGRHIPETKAMTHILGFTCLADNSLRDWQTHSRQAFPGKNFDRSGAIGPWIVTPDEMPPMRDIELETFVNGVRRQHGDCGDLIFSLDHCLSYISSFMTLQPGDVIALGTPPGVASGKDNPQWLKDGDLVELRISGIGSLRNTVKAERREKVSEVCEVGKVS